MRIQSKYGWFFFQINGEIFRWILELGRFSVSWERKP